MDYVLSDGSSAGGGSQYADSTRSAAPEGHDRSQRMKLVHAPPANSDAPQRHMQVVTPLSETEMTTQQRHQQQPTNQPTDLSYHSLISSVSCSLSVCSYKLVPGVSKHSFGMSCAVSAGVPEQLMIRATQVANQIAAKMVRAHMGQLGRKTGSAKTHTVTEWHSSPIACWCALTRLLAD